MISSSSSSSSSSTKEEIVLPLLSAKAANKLANSGTKEMELQKVADMIRTTATANKYKVNVVDLNYPDYIYKELVKEKYVVQFIIINSLKVMWTDESIG